MDAEAYIFPQVFIGVEVQISVDSSQQESLVIQAGVGWRLALRLPPLAPPRCPPDTLCRWCGMSSQAFSPLNFF